MAAPVGPFRRNRPWACVTGPLPAAGTGNGPVAMAPENSPRVPLALVKLAWYNFSAHVVQITLPPAFVAPRGHPSLRTLWDAAFGPLRAAAPGNEPVATALAKPRLVASPVISAWCNFPAHVVQITPIAFVAATTHSASSLRESAFRQHRAAAQVSGPVASGLASSPLTALPVTAD